MIFVVKQMSASKFKEQCLTLLDNLDPTGIIVTKNGRPVARVTPVSADCGGLIGSMKGRLKVKGDILSTGVRWDAEPVPIAR